MARLARVILPGVPYHVTHRGNRRAEVFFCEEEREAYCSILHEYAMRYGMDILGYCLMSNHVHLLVVGRSTDSLANAIGRGHMRYARWFNRWHGFSGHLWANRFFSTPLDQEHLWNAIRYVEQNPVRAHMVRRCEQWRWSSTRANARLCTDPLLCEQRPFLGEQRDWLQWVNTALDNSLVQTLRNNTSTGRPTGSRQFVEQLEQALGRVLRPRKTGRKPKSQLLGPDNSDLFTSQDLG